MKSSRMQWLKYALNPPLLCDVCGKIATKTYKVKGEDLYADLCRNCAYKYRLYDQIEPSLFSDL